MFSFQPRDFAFVFFFSFSIIISYGQTGPGGIEDTSGSSNLVLWLDASKITGVADLNTVGTWEDASGHNHDASISSSSAKPHYRENILNGLPVVGFDGSSGYLQGSLGSNFDAPATVIAIPYYDDINQASGENGYILSVGTGSGSLKHFSIARRRSSGGNGNRYYAWINDGSPKLGDTIVGQQWNIITQTNASSSPYHNMYLNGTVSSSIDDYSGAVNTDGVFRVGQWYHGGTNNLDGRLAELIIYDKVLNTLELNIIHSFLSAKYNINITGDLYTGDTPANGDSDYDVVGLGVLSGDSSKLVSSAGIQVEISQDFDDGDYVLLGHNVCSNSINTVDVNGTLQSRWDRAWYFDITNTGNDVHCDLIFSQIEGDIGLGGLESANYMDYKLIHRSGNSGSWTILETATGVTHSKVIFSDIELTADGYYTVASISSSSPLGSSPATSTFKGPGGVGEIDGSSNLKVWYNLGDMEGADDDEILRLKDESGNDNDVTQETFINIPTLNENSVNGRSAVDFNGTSNYLDGVMGFSVVAPLTIFSVARFDSLNQGNEDNDYVYSVGNGLSRGDQLSLSRRKSNDADDVANINKYYSWDGDTARFGNTITGQTWYAFTQEFRATGASVLHNANINGADANATDNQVAANPTLNTLSVGRWNGNNHWLTGSVGEIVIFNRNLNSAEINIIESYLGGKYGLTITGDKYDGDDPANGDNDLNIAGVGTESDGSNTGANSAGLIIQQTSGFGNGDYALFGHAVATNTVNTVDATDNLGSNEARWDRAWYVDTTNSGSDLVVSMSFDFSDVEADGFPGSGSDIDYSLLFRTATSGTWTNQNIIPTLNGDQVVFSNVTLSDGFYTLGSSATVNSPLPVTLIDFSASKLLNSTLVQWSTESEVNSDYFLLERSDNAIDYRLIEKLTAAGNSTDNHFYSVVDSKIAPYITYYYRLRQFDYDGKSEIFGPIAINGSSKLNGIKVYPNPAKETVYIDGLSSQTMVKLYRTKGELLFEKNNLSGERMQINIQQYEKGVYFLHLTNHEENKVVMLLIQ